MVQGNQQHWPLTFSPQKSSKGSLSNYMLNQLVSILEKLLGEVLHVGDKSMAL